MIIHPFCRLSFNGSFLMLVRVPTESKCVTEPKSSEQQTSSPAGNDLSCFQVFGQKKDP